MCMKFFFSAYLSQPVPNPRGDLLNGRAVLSCKLHVHVHVYMHYCTCTCTVYTDAVWEIFSVEKYIQQLLFKILLWPFMAMKMTKSILLLFLSHFPNYMSITCTLHIYMYVHLQSLFSCDNYIIVWKIFRLYQNNYTCA